MSYTERACAIDLSLQSFFQRHSIKETGADIWRQRIHGVYENIRFHRLRVDGRPKRIKKFAFTSISVYNLLRVDGALEEAYWLLKKLSTCPILLLPTNTLKSLQFYDFVINIVHLCETIKLGIAMLWKFSSIFTPDVSFLKNDFPLVKEYNCHHVIDKRFPIWL